MLVSAEALIGILAVVVSLPPSVLVIWKMIRRRRNPSAGVSSRGTDLGMLGLQSGEY